jgi:hypothetical protein
MNLEEQEVDFKKSPHFKKDILIKAFVFLLFLIFLVISICTHSLIKVDELKLTNNTTSKKPMLI